MTMRVTDRIATTRQRATTADALAGLKRLVTVTNQDEAFALALEEACHQGGLDFAILYSHAANETDLFRDSDFVRDKNPAGIGNTDGTGGVVFESFRAGARFYVGELLLKLRLPVPRILQDARSYAPEKWDQVERMVGGALGIFPTVDRISDLNKRFGPNGREAVWMTDPDGPAAIVAKGNALFPNLPNQGTPTGTTTLPPLPDRRIPTIVLDAGHRSTDRSGNPAETAMTDDLARAYRAELRRRGLHAFWYQQDLDRDSDPDETVGDLNTVAKGLGRWLAGQPWALMLSLHYNGAHSPLHAIVPDNVGLSTAYPEGRDPADTAANNPLDVWLGNRIIVHMNAADLGGVFNGKLHGQGGHGVMSETETGVGLDGFRLAVFAATAPSRETAVRLVVEHGGVSDPAARRFNDFAVAAADAIESVYGKATTPAPTTTTTTTTAAPPVLNLPKGMSQGVAERLFNPHRVVYPPTGEPAIFHIGGRVSDAWLRRCVATISTGKTWRAGKWPAVESITKRGDGRLVWQFSDGFVQEQEILEP